MNPAAGIPMDPNALLPTASWTSADPVLEVILANVVPVGDWLPQAPRCCSGANCIVRVVER